MAVMDDVDIYSEVRSLVAQIPPGKVSTFGDIARSLGDVRAARAVGEMAATDRGPEGSDIPYHRLVMADGTLGGPARSSSARFELLTSEGVAFDSAGKVDMSRSRFNGLKSHSPLDGLRDYQQKSACKVITEDCFDGPERIGGLDIAYRGRTAVAALSIFDHVTGEHLKDIARCYEVRIPYIPGYLAFREVPAYMHLLEECDDVPDVLLVDGNGLLHPRGFGVASHLGVVLDIPTIGVAKSLLCGKLRDGDSDPAGVFVDDRLVGYAHRAPRGKGKPVFTSVGHRLSLDTAMAIVRPHHRNRIPEPLRQAHIAAGRARDRIISTG